MQLRNPAVVASSLGSNEGAMEVGVRWSGSTREHERRCEAYVPAELALMDISTAAIVTGRTFLILLHTRRSTPTLSSSSRFLVFRQVQLESALTAVRVAWDGGGGRTWRIGFVVGVFAKRKKRSQ